MKLSDFTHKLADPLAKHKGIQWAAKGSVPIKDKHATLQAKLGAEIEVFEAALQATQAAGDPDGAAQAAAAPSSSD